MFCSQRAWQISGYWFEQVWDASRLESYGAPAQEQLSNCLEACCTSVERLGAQLFPNDNVFPVWHVTARLEALAGGLWPERAEPCGEDNRVVSAVLKVCT